jgi:hypothetical protein
VVDDVDAAPGRNVGHLQVDVGQTAARPDVEMVQCPRFHVDQYLVGRVGVRELAVLDDVGIPVVGEFDRPQMRCWRVTRGRVTRDPSAVDSTVLSGVGSVRATDGPGPEWDYLHTSRTNIIEARDYIWYAMVAVLGITTRPEGSNYRVGSR